MQEMTAGERTKLSILETGLRLWRAGESVTARRIGRELDLTHGAVLYHFRHGDHDLRGAVAFYAVKQGDEKVISALILERNSAVAHMDETQRLEWLRLANSR